MTENSEKVFQQGSTARTYAEGEVLRHIEPDATPEDTFDEIDHWNNFSQLVANILDHSEKVRRLFARTSFAHAPHNIRWLFIETVGRHREIFFSGLSAEDQLEITQHMKALSQYIHSSMSGIMEVEQKEIIVHIQSFIQKSLSSGGVAYAVHEPEDNAEDFVDDALNQALGQMFRDQKDRSR